MSEHDMKTVDIYEMLQAAEKQLTDVTGLPPEMLAGKRHITEQDFMKTHKLITDQLIAPLIARINKLLVARHEC